MDESAGMDSQGSSVERVCSSLGYLRKDEDEREPRADEEKFEVAAGAVAGAVGSWAQGCSDTRIGMPGLGSLGPIYLGGS